MYIRQLHVRYRPRRLTSTSVPLQHLRLPADAARVFQVLLSEEAVEVAGLLCLSTRREILAYHEVGRGTVDSSLVHPREVFKAALLANATAIILGHNHPSGDVTPSSEDRNLTDRILNAGLLMGIELLDHVIVGIDGKYLSFRDAGLL